VNIFDELNTVCDCLEVGVLESKRIHALLRDSIRLHQAGEPSFHRGRDQTPCEIKDQIVIQLSKLAQIKGRNRDTVAIQEAKRIRGLAMLFDAKYSEETIDIISHVDKLFAECKGSHADKGRAMAKKLPNERWEAYKKARGGRPIEQTKQQHFTQRSKDAAKKPK